jgi:hypothetical protein
MEEKSLVSIDIGALASYLDKVKEIASVNKMMGAVYLRDFIQGQDVAGALLAKAVQADIRAKARLEQAEAIAYLDNAADYLQSKNIKDSSEARKRYVDIDSDVVAAKDDKARTEALVSLLKNKVSILRMAHDDLKKILYGDQQMSQWEVVTITHGKKTDIFVVREWAKSLGGELLSAAYKNMLIRLTWRCSRNHVFDATFNHIKNRGQWCPICGKEKSQINMKKALSTQEVREKISKSHLNRLKKQNKFAGKSQRKVASIIRDHTTGLLRDPKKHKSILKYIGCSIEDLRKHLESQFIHGMSWENRGFHGWHIDHIKPLADFDLTDEKQLYIVCNYKNLQPMWKNDNLKKHCN